MLKIRLQRVGRKHAPSFRVVLTDSKRATQSGAYIEMLGSYDATRSDDPALKEDRIKYWISNGAQVSNTVHNLLVGKKVIEGKKVDVSSKKNVGKKEAEAKAKAEAEAVIVEKEKEEAGHKAEKQENDVVPISSEAEEEKKEA